MGGPLEFQISAVLVPVLKIVEKGCYNRYSGRLVLTTTRKSGLCPGDLSIIRWGLLVLYGSRVCLEDQEIILYA